MKKNMNGEIDKLQLKIVRVFDEFTQFSDRYTFLCDSFAAIEHYRNI